MEPVYLNLKEARRLEIITQVDARTIPQAQAATLLALSVRQIKRLVRRYRSGGAAALISRHRGKPPNNALTPELKTKALQLYCERYADFGPTLAAEKLREEDGIMLHHDTLRRYLIANGLWKSKRRRTQIHPPRERRERFGELMQSDGSPHPWFEERAPRCTLIITIDDATSWICQARFFPAETTEGYFALFERHFRKEGLPYAFYVDRHSIFRTTRSVPIPQEYTRVSRALETLGITLICATSPQAKGRVERAFRTLQDRLVKELRLRNISTIEEANAFLPTFLQGHNARFAQPPASPEDAHRPLGDWNLEEVFCDRSERVLTKNHTIQIGDAIYRIEDPQRKLWTGMRIAVAQFRDGTICTSFQGAPLTHTFLHQRDRAARIIDAKTINAHLDAHIAQTKKPHPAPANHPWRRQPLSARQPSRGHF